MAIVISNDGDKIVNSIAERNAIAKKFDGMLVSVKDAIGDPATGGGFAKYEWVEDGALSRWVLLSVDDRPNVKFATERLTIDGDLVIASNIPNDGEVWQARIIDGVTGVILGDVRPTVTLADIRLDNANFDGHKLEFTYAYGTWTASLGSIFYELKDKHRNMVNNEIDLSIGSIFSKTIVANTVLTVVKTEAANIVDSFIIEITNGGAFTIEWFSGISWDGGMAPSLTTEGTDVLAFYTFDAGVSWRGMVASVDSRPVN